MFFYTFIKLSGTRDSKTKKSKLQLHEISEHHITAIIRWSAHKNSQKTGIVATKLLTTNQEQIQRNKEYMKCLIDIIIFLGRQGIPYRGHHEDEQSLNKGNN